MSATLTKRHCIRAIPLNSYVGHDGEGKTILTNMATEIILFHDEGAAEWKIREIVDWDTFITKENVLAYEIVTVYLQPK